MIKLKIKPLRVKRIKAIPIKSDALCDKCVFDCTSTFTFCGEHCPMYNTQKTDDEQWHCTCLNVEEGEPCRHFKRKEGVDNGK